jgi:hypothetical protein
LILNLQTDHHYGVPCVGEGNSCVDVVPGYSEIDDKTWASCRKNALRLIASGRLKEEWIKVDTKESEGKLIVIETEDTKETSKRLIPATLTDIDRKQNKVINVVKGCFHPATLNKWYAEELRQDVRVEIQKQIEGIDKGTIKG